MGMVQLELTKQVLIQVVGYYKSRKGERDQEKKTMLTKVHVKETTRSLSMKRSKVNAGKLKNFIQKKVDAKFVAGLLASKEAQEEILDNQVINTTRPFTLEELKHIRQVWAEFFLRLYAERMPIGKEERRKKLK